MFQQLFANLKKHEHNDEFISQRRFPRRDRDACICTIHGTAYAVENWSLGGALIQAPGKFFSLDTQIPITMKFYTGTEILDIDVRAKIVRKTNNKIALQFLPLKKNTLNKFQAVLKS